MMDAAAMLQTQHNCFQQAPAQAVALLTTDLFNYMQV
jgi:hypothetical protein